MNLDCIVTTLRVEFTFIWVSGLQWDRTWDCGGAMARPLNGPLPKRRVKHKINLSHSPSPHLSVILVAPASIIDVVGENTREPLISLGISIGSEVSSCLGKCTGEGEKWWLSPVPIASCKDTGPKKQSLYRKRGLRWFYEDKISRLPPITALFSLQSCPVITSLESIQLVELWRCCGFI